MLSSLRKHPFLGIGILVLTIGFVSMPREAYAGDAMAVRLASLHLLLKGTIGIDETEKHSLGEMTSSEGQYFFFNADRHAYYPKWGFLNTLLLTPPLVVEDWIQGIDDLFGKPSPGDEMVLYDRSLILILNLYNLLVSIGIAFYFFKLAGLYSNRTATATLFVLVTFYATFLWNYLRAPSLEIFQVFFFAACAYHFIRFQRLIRENQNIQAPGWRNLLASTCFAGLLVFVKPYYALLFPVLFGFAACECFRRGPRLLGALWLNLLLPAGVFIAVLLCVQWYQFGSPFEFGYGQWKADGKPHDSMSPGNIPVALRGLFVAPSFSVFTHFPILLFAFLGFRSFWRNHRMEFLFILSTLGVFLTLIASFSNWSGQFCYGPRYLLFILPVLSLPLIPVMDRLIERPRKAGSVLIGLFLLATIAISARLQTRVNSLPFMTVLFLSQTYGQLRDSKTTNYLERTHHGVIAERFMASLERGGKFPPLELARKNLPPQKRGLILEFEEYQHSAAFAPNYFFAYSFD